jgi:hypothetical protein
MGSLCIAGSIPAMEERQPGIMRIKPSKKCDLAPPAQGWFAIAYALTSNGQLARLSATVDVHGRWRRHRELARVGEKDLEPIVPAAARARIDVFDGNRQLEGPEFELETPFPTLDCLPDGRWVVAGTRCAVGEYNARLINSDGTIARRMCLGDGIRHLQCDPQGRIWVGYFDEGIYGNFGWGWGPGQPEPIGAPGINRFDEYGELLPILRSSFQPGPNIDDCYAMNVSKDGVWACVYTDFPILNITFEGTYRIWQNKDILGASALALKSDHVVLIGGYQDEENRGALLRLGDDRSKPVFQFAFDVLGHGLRSLSLVAARGDEIHFVTEGCWLWTTVGDVVTATGRA